MVSTSPAATRCQGRSWCHGDGLKWLDWRETGAPNCSKSCSPDRAEQRACFHSRCWWSVGGDHAAHSSDYRNAQIRWEEPDRRPTSVSHSKAPILTDLVTSFAVFKSPLRAWLRVGPFRCEILRLFDNSIPDEQIRWASSYSGARRERNLALGRKIPSQFRSEMNLWISGKQPLFLAQAPPFTG